MAKPHWHKTKAERRAWWASLTDEQKQVHLERWEDVNEVTKMWRKKYLAEPGFVAYADGFYRDLGEGPAPWL